MKFLRLLNLLQLIYLSQALKAGRNDIAKVHKLSRHDLVVIRAPTNGGITLSKRQTLIKSIQVVLHFDCPFTGKSHEIFEWSVVYDSSKHDIQYFRHTNIDGFHEGADNLDKDHLPATFVGSWYYNDWEEIEYDEYVCRLSYIGHFEGLVQWSDVTVVFVDADVTGRQMPVITEHCCGRASHTGGHPFTPYSCGRRCRFDRAEVSWPRFV